MYRKLLSLTAALVLVAACESTPGTTGAATGSGLGGTGLSGPGGGPGGLGGPGSGIGSERVSVTPGSAEDLRVNVGDRVFFPYDRSDLTPEGRATLDRQAAWLKQYGQVAVTIEGHADERGTREYNIGLGNRRATAVRNYLAALGIPADRINIVSYGKERPAVVGESDDSWAQNRRGVTIVN